ncbi:hypothetical protein MPSEU_000256900 [Mayamaea pseudoterrestris]|nr:hypothetical protein MPSEU_000256900 [Mayamaea pseudoterrestris]
MSSDRMQAIPVSLGKPSFRRRIEDYYSIVAPDQLQNDWNTRFRQIWDIYGGSHEKEGKLRANLDKKYGTTVRFLTVASKEKCNRIGNSSQDDFQHRQFTEESFQLADNQRGSGVLDCLSVNFDPAAFLGAPLDDVYEACRWLETSNKRMDHVEMIRPYLPKSDPMFIPRPLGRRRVLPPAVAAKPKPIHAFVSLANPLKNGPFSILYNSMLNQVRIRVVVSYVDCIRGTLTGFITGFDKFLNMILRDVEEVYSPRRVGAGDRTKLELEMERRLSGAFNCNVAGQWMLRHRRLGQMMVRGETVVSVYQADHEKSTWPVTSKSPDCSLYRHSAKKNIPPEERIGTPGSLLHASQKVACEPPRMDDARLVAQLRNSCSIRKGDEAKARLECINDPIDTMPQVPPEQ